MSTDRPSHAAARTTLAVVAAYLTFLLFAQFGFLRQLERDLGSAGAIRSVMAWMGAGGFLASLGAAAALTRVAPARLVRIGFVGCSATAIASLACHQPWSLRAVAALIGVAIAGTTVALATGLRDFAPGRHVALVAGAGTGIAYAIANTPPLFEAEPWLRAAVPAACCLLAAVWPPRATAIARTDPARHAPPLWRVLPAFLLLVWLDSAAFTFIQQTAALKAKTWSASSGEALQGATHLLAALAAGWLLDRGRFGSVLVATGALFAVALPLLEHGGSLAGIGGPLYAIGISLYSVALVTFPSSAEGDDGRARWRAAVLYGVAGWIGSALGVGMAQDLGRLPYALVGAAGVAVLFAVAPVDLLRAQSRIYGGALAIGVVGSLVVLRAAPREAPADDVISRGREVYVAEGCIHCHSQYVRPRTRDEAWWGPFRPLDRREEPPLVGNRRQGPDLMNVGRRRSARWQEIHLRDPRAVTPASRMPSYAHLFAGDGTRGVALVAYLGSLGAGTPALAAPLPTTVIAPPHARAQGKRLFGELCAPCHGAGGRGDGPLAASLADPRVNLRDRDATGRDIQEIVRHGVPGTSMPGHEYLADDEIAALAAYVRAVLER